MFLSSQLQSVPKDKGLKLRTTTINPRKPLKFPKVSAAMEKKTWDSPGCPVVKPCLPMQGELRSHIVPKNQNNQNKLMLRSEKTKFCKAIILR